MLKDHFPLCELQVAYDSPAVQQGAHACTFPGCGFRAHTTLRIKIHKVAELRQHMQLLLDHSGDFNNVQDELKSALQEALTMFPPDLCVNCKEAEGDTIKCRNCLRFLHECCDEGEMENRVCQLCHQLRWQDRTEGRVEEALASSQGGQGGVDRCDVGLEDDLEEDDLEEDLSGFVVGDGHISWSSREGEDDDDEEEEEEEEPNLDDIRQRKKQKRDAFVIESSETGGDSGKKKRRSSVDHIAVAAVGKPSRTLVIDSSSEVKSPRKSIDLVNSSGGDTPKKSHNKHKKHKKHKNTKTLYLDD
jgi:hypothetical protein